MASGYGETKIVRNDTERIIANARARARALYERARERGQQSLESLTPVDTGNLKASSKAEPLRAADAPRSRDARGRFANEEIGFSMRSFGDEANNKAYARWVNGGHHTASGSFVPANPYFSQSVADASAVIKEGLPSVLRK